MAPVHDAGVSSCFVSARESRLYEPAGLAQHRHAGIGESVARHDAGTRVAPEGLRLGQEISFGIATALGIIAGAFVWAVYAKKFRIEGFASAADTWHHMVGAILMGFGGVTALGCTFGQGITGVSTLAIGSLLVITSIIAGAVATMKYMCWREMEAESSSMARLRRASGTSLMR